MKFEKFSRRNFLKLGTGILTAACLSESNPINAFGMLGGKRKSTIPVGLQLYSVRKECEKDFPGTIAKVAKMGYQGVEFAGYYDYSAKEVRKMLDDNGLICCGTHTQIDTVKSDALKETIEYNQILGNNYLIIPWLGEEYRVSKESWLKIADLLNEIAEKTKPHGMQIGYHNHNFEFIAIDGVMPWDIIFSNTSKDVIMQIDTCNAMMGGANPVDYLKKYPGRAVTIHLKEYSATNKNAIMGEGDVDWQQVFTLCESIGGTKWYIIEEEKDAYPPLEAVDLCLKNYWKLRS